MRGVGDFVLEGALGLAKLREEDGLGGNLAEIAGEAELVEGPDDPLGGIELPRLHAVAVIVLKLVVIIVVALAEGDEGHDPAIAGAAAAGVGPGAEGVAGGIDAEGAMLEADDAGDAGDEETAERADPALVEPAEQRREDRSRRGRREGGCSGAESGRADRGRDRGRYRKGAAGSSLNMQPADVGVEEALADVVGVFLVIDVLVMAAMLGAPHEGGVLERGGAEEEGEEPDGPMRLEGEMGEDAGDSRG